jgi:hypothetical protein
MRAKHWCVSVCAGLLIIASVSCTGKAVKVGIEEPEPRITSEEKDETAVLVDRLISFNNKASFIEGNAFVIYKDNEETYSFRIHAIADMSRKNYRLSIDEYVFKIPLFTVIKNSNDVLAITHSKKTYTLLCYEDLDFSSVADLHIPKDFFLHAVFGAFYVIEGNKVFSSPEEHILRIEGTNEIQQVVFSKEMLPVESSYSLSDEFVNVQFSKYREVASTQFPHKITISDDQKILKINYSKLQIDTPVSSDTFALDTSGLEGYSRTQ